jgi:hypothetical protein
MLFGNLYLWYDTVMRNKHTARSRKFLFDTEHNILFAKGAASKVEEVVILSCGQSQALWKAAVSTRPQSLSKTTTQNFVYISLGNVVVCVQSISHQVTGVTSQQWSRLLYRHTAPRHSTEAIQTTRRSKQQFIKRKPSHCSYWQVSLGRELETNRDFQLSNCTLKITWYLIYYIRWNSIHMFQLVVRVGWWWSLLYE